MSAATQNPFRKSSRKSFAACKAQVLALTKLGCSRRLAAEKAGCCHTTIGRAARRDPAFAAELEEAENHVDVAALTRIQEASAENKNWRAAAWMLERRHPEEFGRRAPHSLSGDQVMAVLAEIFSFTMPLVPQKESSDFLRAFNRAMRGVEGNAKNGDRSQKLAGVNVARGPHGKPLCSPYEHPQWRDPDRPTTAKEERDEAYAWVDTLPTGDLERVRETWNREAKAERERRQETMKNMLMRLLAEEKAEEAATEAQKNEPAGKPVADPTAVVEPRSTLEDPAVEPVAEVSAPAAPAEMEQNCPEATEEIAPPATSPSPLRNVQQAEHFDTPQNSPPDAVKHQSYQEAPMRQTPLLLRNILLAQELRRRAGVAPRGADVAGGAYEARLQEWCEAMRR